MQTYLFIGGAHDGLSFPVTEDIEGLKLPEGVTEKANYVRDTLAVADVTITVYRHESLTPEQALDKLVEYYKAWCANQAGRR